jgi:hypothetical protein
LPTFENFYWLLLLKITKRVTDGLKTSKYHIIHSWILLICFIAGQLMVYGHQHNTGKSLLTNYSTHKNIPQQTVKEKCYLCDVMNHNTMVIASQAYFSPTTVTLHIFKSVGYSFTSIQLIISGGRAPPLTNYLT